MDCVATIPEYYETRKGDSFVLLGKEKKKEKENEKHTNISTDKKESRNIFHVSAQKTV